MEQKKRAAAWFFAGLAMFVMLYSVLFIAVETGHDCVGENCAVCCQIKACEHMLKSFAGAACAAATGAAVCYTLCKGVLPCAEVFASCDLVSRKVKLTD